MITKVKNHKHWIVLAGIISIAYWFWKRSSSPYRHRFTDFTDTLASPYNLGFPIYNWVFNVLGWTQWISIIVGGLILAGLSMIRLDRKRHAKEKVGAEYYVRNQDKLFEEHRKMAAAGREIIVARYGKAFADTLLSESLAEFETLIPALPYIGGKQNPLTDNLISSAGALALYRVMQRHGKTVEETGELLYRMMEAWIMRYPRLMRRLMGRYFMSRLSQRQSKKRSALSQQRRYPADWVREHIEGDSQTFDWGVNYLECGIVKFLHSQGAGELAPYLCLLDYVLFGALDIGLTRTQTLAIGNKKCDFRFKWGGETPSGWPPPWLETK
jgi:hypothetical protein